MQVGQAALKNTIEISSNHHAHPQPIERMRLARGLVREGMDHGIVETLAKDSSQIIRGEIVVIVLHQTVGYVVLSWYQAVGRHSRQKVTPFWETERHAHA